MIKKELKRKNLLPCASLVLVLFLLTPSIISVINILSPDNVAKMTIANIEEEKEEERSGAEDDLKEIKEFTLPNDLSDKDAYSLGLAIKHQYAFRAYSSLLSVPYLPPELIG